VSAAGPSPVTPPAASFVSSLVASTRRNLPGLVIAAVAVLVAWAVHTVLPAVPLLTACVLLGILIGQLPATRRLLTGAAKPGLSFAAKRLMRIGVVLLGLKLSLVDVFSLGWVTLVSTILIVFVTFGATLWLGRLMKLPGHEPLLVATGFSICGASAIGAMGGVVRADEKEQATPVALVTLCGTLAIFVLPALWHPLGLDATQFGHWTGASVHDVGQVVATAQIAGPSALAVALVVKLTRVLMLAPIVGVAGVVVSRRDAASARPAAKRPPLIPLFVAGFVGAVLVRTFVDVPAPVLAAADTLQTVLLGLALVALGAAIRVASLVRTGWRALIVGLGSWALIAVLAFGAVQLG